MIRFALITMLLLPAFARADDPTFEENRKRQEQEIERAKQRYREMERQYDGARNEPGFTNPEELRRLIEKLQKDGLLKRHSSPEKRVLDELKKLQAEVEEHRARMLELEAERLELVHERLQALKGTDDDIRKPIYRNGPPPAPPLADGVTGKVESCQDGMVKLNIGLDAGLVIGTKMDLYRGEGTDSVFLGKIVVQKVFPKEAVAKFKPASGKELKDLKADELPKKHDLAGTYKGK